MMDKLKNLVQEVERVDQIQEGLHRMESNTIRKLINLIKPIARLLDRPSSFDPSVYGVPFVLVNGLGQVVLTRQGDLLSPNGPLDPEDLVALLDESGQMMEEVFTTLMSELETFVDRTENKVRRACEKRDLLADVISALQEVTCPKGYRRVRWSQLTKGDRVFVCGRRRQGFQLYGPFWVHNSKRRELFKSSAIFPYNEEGTLFQKRKKLTC